jgi:hypothetical protein
MPRRKPSFLGIRLPFVFESGGGLYDLTTNTLTWNPILTEALKADIEAIHAWAQREIFPNFPGAIPEFAKFTDTVLIHRETSVIDDIYDLATVEIAAHFPLFEVHRTDVSVNIIVKKAGHSFGPDGLYWGFQWGYPRPRASLYGLRAT